VRVTRRVVHRAFCLYPVCLSLSGGTQRLGIAKFVSRPAIVPAGRVVPINPTQGMNMLAATLLLTCPTEEDAFWILCCIVEVNGSPHIRPERVNGVSDNYLGGDISGYCPRTIIRRGYWFLRPTSVSSSISSPRCYPPSRAISRKSGSNCPRSRSAGSSPCFVTVCRSRCARRVCSSGLA
jgi:hypothetical protein